MVGGEVTCTIEDGDRIYVDCKNPQNSRETCAIYVVKNEHSQQIIPGDKLWWQGNEAFWTSSRVPGAKEIAIPRCSYSGVKPPNFGRRHDASDR